MIIRDHLCHLALSNPFLVIFSSFITLLTTHFTINCITSSTKTSTHSVVYRDLINMTTFIPSQTLSTLQSTLGPSSLLSQDDKDTIHNIIDFMLVKQGKTAIYKNNNNKITNELIHSTITEWIRSYSVDQMHYLMSCSKSNGLSYNPTWTSWTGTDGSMFSTALHSRYQGTEIVTLLLENGARWDHLLGAQQLVDGKPEDDSDLWNPEWVRWLLHGAFDDNWQLEAEIAIALINFATDGYKKHTGTDFPFEMVFAKKLCRNIVNGEPQVINAIFEKFPQICTETMPFMFQYDPQTQNSNFIRSLYTIIRKNGVPKTYLKRAMNVNAAISRLSKWSYRHPVSPIDHDAFSWWFYTLMKFDSYERSYLAGSIYNKLNSNLEANLEMIASIEPIVRSYTLPEEYCEQGGEVVGDDGVTKVASAKENWFKLLNFITPVLSKDTIEWLLAKEGVKEFINTGRFDPIHEDKDSKIGVQNPIQKAIVEGNIEVAQFLTDNAKKNGIESLTISLDQDEIRAILWAWCQNRHIFTAGSNAFSDVARFYLDLIVKTHNKDDVVKNDANVEQANNAKSIVNSSFLQNILNSTSGSYPPALFGQAVTSSVENWTNFDILKNIPILINFGANPCLPLSFTSNTFNPKLLSFLPPSGYHFISFLSHGICNLDANNNNDGQSNVIVTDTKGAIGLDLLCDALCNVLEQNIQFEWMNSICSEVRKWPL